MKIDLGRLTDFAEGKPYRVETGENSVVLVRVGDDVYALQDRCSHQNVPLSEGDVYTEDGEIECHKHGSAFSLETGEALNLPATQPVPTYQVTVEDGQVLLHM